MCDAEQEMSGCQQTVSDILCERPHIEMHSQLIEECDQFVMGQVA